MRTPKAPYIGFLFFVFAASSAFAQTSCGQALSQLQGYVNQVNYAANVELSGGIQMRCSGQPACMQMLYGQLNSWYYQQAAMVNTWYGQLSQQCSNQGGTKTVRRPKAADDELQVEDLEMDDEDKTVKIKIPSSPRGFKR